jgi:hypothetical protein
LYSTDGVDGWCSNIDPPGFYAVLFYDGAVFNLLTRSANDYSASTNFHVYTTTGYLKRISPIASAFSFTDMSSTSVKVASYHSNVMYTSNTSSVNTTGSPQYAYYGDVSCETNPAGTNGAVDCLNKGDQVMFLNAPTSSYSSRGMAKNPVYPNIYRVLKIAREERQWEANAMSEILRHQITLNAGVNSAFTDSLPGSIYKFYPPVNSASSTVNYVGQCSNRGLCDNTQGVCTCFNGYTGIDCSNVNALAQ